jgi:hypothetical protein
MAPELKVAISKGFFFVKVNDTRRGTYSKLGKKTQHCFGKYRPIAGRKEFKKAKALLKTKVYYPHLIFIIC